MDTYQDAHTQTQLQQRDVDGERTRREHEQEVAAEAYHRQRILTGDRPRLEDLAKEWIELLRTRRV